MSPTVTNGHQKSPTVTTTADGLALPACLHLPRHQPLFRFFVPYTMFHSGDGKANDSQNGVS
jgi:hypothetical protein